MMGGVFLGGWTVGARRDGGARAMDFVLELGGLQG